jgi:multicomponent K+:H+ antiporter subunit E
VRSRLLPHPVLSLALLATWLLLNGSLAPTTLLMGAIVALLVPFAMRPLSPPPVRLGRPGAMLRLLGQVAADMVRSNIAVARIILGGREAERVSGFVVVPLEIRSPYGLAALAIIVTSVPGTLWVQYDPRTGRLLMHVLDLHDGDDWAAVVKERYEQPLREIFE